MNQYGCDRNIEHVIGGRQSAFSKQGKYNNLKRIGGNGQNHGGSETGAGRKWNWLVRYNYGSHISLDKIFIH